MRDADELALPLGASKTSPVSSVDVAAILDDSAPHVGHIYNLTGPESADLDALVVGPFLFRRDTRNQRFR
jgi:uncharacterized protein YbjT (DUF2867 family)